MAREVWVIEDERGGYPHDPTAEFSAVCAFDTETAATAECDPNEHERVVRYVPAPVRHKWNPEKPPKPGQYICRMSYGYIVAEWTSMRWFGGANNPISDPISYTELPRPPEGCDA